MKEVPAHTLAALTAAKVYGEPAASAPERNTWNEYFWMSNRHGRIVPVPLNREQECLMKGYIHTDRVVNSDRKEDRTPSPMPAASPQEVMVELMKTMKAQNDVTSLTEALKENPEIMKAVKTALTKKESKKAEEKIDEKEEK